MTARLLLLLLAAAAPAQTELVVDFEAAPVLLQPSDKAHRVEQWEEKGVVFKLAHEPRMNKAKGLVMFFENLSNGHKGLGSGMALEPIPVRATFPKPVTTVAISFWGSTATPVVLEAFDAAGTVVDRAAIPTIPTRKTPADPTPVVTLSVTAKQIAYIQFSGPRKGEFLAADELRFKPTD